MVRHATADGSLTKETFRAWPGKQVNKEMTKKTGGLKRKASLSTDHDLESEHEGCEEISPNTFNAEEQRQLVQIQDERPSIFQEDDHNVQHPHQPREAPGAARPPEGGYRGQAVDRRLGEDWGEDYNVPYGQMSSSSYRGNFQRPWLLGSYESGRDFGGSPVQYGIRSREFQGRSNFIDRRDLYYDGRGRDYDRRDREYQEHRCYEEDRYARRPQIPVDTYRHGVQPSVSTQYARSSWLASSPPPSSSAVVEKVDNTEEQARRPLCLDKTGKPTGKMESLFVADITAFAKDMDPNFGWEGQTKAAKERLLSRLTHDYVFYGESSRLNEKYLRKRTGSALTQFRYTLNQSIDRGEDKPEDLNPEYWDALKKTKESTESKQKSAKMSTIARRRGAKNSTKKSLEQSVLLRLSRDLKREPFDVELQEAVEREWAIVQEEVADRKRQRAVKTASNAATEATKDMQEHLHFLEAFVQKWEPEFIAWKEMHFNNQEVHLPNSGARERAVEQQLRFPANDREDELPQKSEEEKTMDTSDDDESDKKDPSSGDEESDSDEESSESDGDEAILENMQSIHVVEPEEENVIKAPSKRTVRSTANTGLCAPTSSRILEDRSIAGFKSTENVGIASYTPQAKEKGNETSGTSRRGSFVGKQVESAVSDPKEGKAVQDGPQPASNGKEPESRPMKRQKVDCIGASTPLLVDKERPNNSIKKPPLPMKSNKEVRNTTKATNTEVAKKRVKGNTDLVGDVKLLQNTEPTKLLGSGVLVHSDFDGDRVVVPGRSEVKLVRLLLKAVSHPHAPLPFVEVDCNGKVQCSPLGEALKKQHAIWWPSPPGLN